MYKNTFSYLVLSDIHLGHNNNKTSDIVNNLKTYFKDNHKLFKTLDAIFIAGDTFDKLLTTNSREYTISLEWLSELVLYCGANNIKLRILEGTPAHDWHQVATFINTLNKLQISLDFKYIDTLYIEYFIEHDIRILYIPDEYKHNASATYKDILKLLKLNNVLQVDCCIMHGQFNYQLPMVKLISSHDENNYLDIVKHYISIGHIHTPSVYDRILAQGSFDRLQHGEEEDKGGMYIKISNNDTREFRFIKNHNAKIFKTINLDFENIDDLIKELDNIIFKLPIMSFVRCIVNDSIYINKSIKIIKERYSGYKISFETKENLKIKNNLLDTNEVFNLESFNITKDNVKDLLKDELTKYNLSNSELMNIDNELTVILNNF